MKVRGGLWVKIFDSTKRVVGRSEMNYTFHASMSCNKKRRWKFKLLRAEGCAHDYTWYKPNASDWITKTTLQLGDLHNKCN